jgi:hypothetical protein
MMIFKQETHFQIIIKQIGVLKLFIFTIMNIGICFGSMIVNISEIMIKQ